MNCPRYVQAGESPGECSTANRRVARGRGCGWQLKSWGDWSKEDFWESVKFGGVMRLPLQGLCKNMRFGASESQGDPDPHKQCLLGGRRLQ